MELKVTNISYELEDEEGLSYLIFKTKSGYFSLSRLDEDDKVHLELDDQSKGRYLDPNYFDFDFDNGKIILEIDEDFDLDEDIGDYQNITLLFNPLENKEFNKAVTVFERIFKDRF